MLTGSYVDTENVLYSFIRSMMSVLCNPVVVLQQACGFEYTSKLQRMFQDIGVSKDLNDKFKTHLANTEALDGMFS